MSGLDPGQLDEIEERITALLENHGTAALAAHENLPCAKP